MPDVFSDLPEHSSLRETEGGPFETSTPLFNRTLLKFSPIIVVVLTAVTAIAFNTYLFGLKDRGGLESAAYQVTLEKLAASTEQEPSAGWHFGLTSTHDAQAGIIMRTGEEIPKIVHMPIELKAGIRTLATGPDGELFRYAHSNQSKPTRICAFAAESSSQLHVLINQIGDLLQKLPNSSCIDFQ